MFAFSKRHRAPTLILLLALLELFLIGVHAQNAADVSQNGTALGPAGDSDNTSNDATENGTQITVGTTAPPKIPEADAVTIKSGIPECVTPKIVTEPPVCKQDCSLCDITTPPPCHCTTEGPSTTTTPSDTTPGVPTSTVNGTDCVVETSKVAGQEYWVWLIVAGVVMFLVGLAVGALIACLVLCCCCKKKLTKKPEDEEDPQLVTATDVSTKTAIPKPAPATQSKPEIKVPDSKRSTKEEGDNFQPAKSHFSAAEESKKGAKTNDNRSAYLHEYNLAEPMPRGSAEPMPHGSGSE